MKNIYPEKGEGESIEICREDSRAPGYKTERKAGKRDEKEVRSGRRVRRGGPSYV